jgi:hypothetical protein
MDNEVHIRMYWCDGDETFCGLESALVGSISHKHYLEQPQHCESLTMCSVCQDKSEHGELPGGFN